MRVALMTNNYKPFIGGVPISVERLARGLEAQGHEVTVFAPTYEEQNYGQQEEENCVRYASLAGNIMGGIVLPNPFDRRIEKEFRKKRYDVIHVHHPMLIGRTAAALSRKYKIPLVFTYHTRYDQYLYYLKILKKGALLAQVQEKLVPLWLRGFLRRCDMVFAPTPGMKDYLLQSCGCRADEVAVLPTGVEDCKVSSEEKMQIRKAYEAEDMPMFLSVSRMAQEKNIDFLLKSVARFKEQYRRRFCLLMVGDGPDRERYEELCRELSLEQEVRFTGRIQNEELAPYFAAADAFLFASRTETQGIVVLEAFQGRTPVIALEATGVSDVVVHGENGLLAPEDMDILAKNILDYVTDKELAASLQEGAAKTVQDYHEEAVAQKAIRLYNGVIARYREEQTVGDKYLHPTIMAG